MRRRRLRLRKGAAATSNRRLAYAIGPREIGLRSAFRESLDGFLALMHGQNRGPPKAHATGLGTDRPSQVRAMISARSNSARPPKTVASAGRGQSWCPPRRPSDLKPAPAFATVSRM